LIRFDDDENSRMCVMLEKASSPTHDARASTRFEICSPLHQDNAHWHVDYSTNNVVFFSR